MARSHCTWRGCSTSNGIELAHAGTDHIRQAPAHRGFRADFVERDAEHQHAGIGFDCAVFDMPADLIPLGVEIEHHQQLADLPHQRADHGFFAGAQIAAFGQLAGDAARQQRAVQFEFRVDAARRAVMKVIDDFQADHQMADRVHAEHHQRARHGGDVAAERHVHGRVGKPQHFLRKAKSDSTTCTRPVKSRSSLFIAAMVVRSDCDSIGKSPRSLIRVQSRSSTAAFTM